ncbi:hypothetical protein [Egicoccus halophilus]|uniref:Polyketide cyclase / dehydrase and lipid transport n=1 Tax=Egicoccus halophilus TaxID=1670830 RepID=A0A8J3AES0_9ACTN|nr:hypothetical protein [Egicoccus halophilus]GGI07267.1 hypothetical protein GCM10011354_23230 [Egicoccus halophilus]
MKGSPLLELHVDDDGFVRAPVALVHRRLSAVDDWPTWWPGLRVRAMPPERAPGAGADGPAQEVWALELPAAPLRRLRVAARLHDRRHEQGFLLALRGEVNGRAEFWLEPTGGGTVVHHLLTATVPSASSRRLQRDYRRAVRQGLWGLKDRLHLEARTSAGLVP